MFDSLYGCLVFGFVGLVGVGGVAVLVQDQIEKSEMVKANLEYRLSKSHKRNKKLKAKLAEKTNELKRAKNAIQTARFVAESYHDDEIIKLRKELDASYQRCANLEVMLEQKWREASGNDLQVG